MRSRLLLLLPTSLMMVACAGDTFAPADTSTGGSAGASGTAGGAGRPQAGSGGAAGNGAAGGGRAGAAGSSAGTGGSSGTGAGAGTGGSGGAGAGGADAAGAGGADPAGAGGADAAGAAGADAAGAAGAAGGGQGGTAAGAAGGGQGGAAGGGQGGTAAGAAGGGQGGAAAGAGGNAAGQGGSAGVGGGGAGGATGGPPNVYVSPDGNDADNTGLTTDSPKRTVSAGILVAIAQNRSTVRICKGSYTESAKVVLPEGISLLGGYDCTKFETRTTHTKELFCGGTIPKEERTTIDLGEPIVIQAGNAAVPTVLSQLDVTGSNVAIFVLGTSPTIEDNRIRISQNGQKFSTTAVRVSGGGAKVRQNCLAGGDGKVSGDGEPGSAAITLDAEATAIVQNNDISGGMGKGVPGNKGSGSVGVYISNAAPEILGNRIDGGEGTSDALGRVASVGLAVVAPPGGVGYAPTIKQNFIDGGDGTHTQKNGNGSIGISVSRLDGGSALSPKILNNTINGGGGTNVPGITSSGIGISLFQVDADLTGNTITGGRFSGPSSQGGSIGVNMVSSTGVLQRNAILGGNGKYQETIGIIVGNSPKTVVDNNMIHGGYRTALDPTRSFALHVDTASTEFMFRHNTVVLGPQDGRNVGVLVTGVALAEGMGKTRFENNLLIGSGVNEGVGFDFSICPEALLGRFAGNGLANLSASAVALPANGACASATASTALETFQPGLAGACTGKLCEGNVLGNVHLRNTCTAPADTCVELAGCFSQKACGTQLFEAWSDDAGVSTLLGSSKPGAIDGGWRLKAAKGCLARETTHVAELLADFYSEVARTSSYSRGAHEQNACTE